MTERTSDNSRLKDASHEAVMDKDYGMPWLKLKVFIVGNCFREGAISMFAAAGCRGADTVKEADLVCFLGGEDVDPALYGEQAHRMTHFNRDRDDREIQIFEEAMAAERPCFGICRGMQLLHVLNDGKLYQHVNNHGRTHLITDIYGTTLLASSMHHQQCIENDTTFPLAYSKGHSGTYFTYGSELASDKVLDLEAAVWPNINSIGIQGHPEVPGLPDFTAWSMRMVDDFLSEKFTGEAPKSIADVDFIKRSITE